MSVISEKVVVCAPHQRFLANSSYKYWQQCIPCYISIAYNLDHDENVWSVVKAIVRVLSECKYVWSDLQAGVPVKGYLFCIW